MKEIVKEPVNVFQVATKLFTMVVGQLGQWHVSLFGGLRVAREGGNEVRMRSKKAGGVLAYLAYFRGQPTSRETLIDLFWPECEMEVGRQNLRAALAILRREFEQEGHAGSFLMADREAAWFNPDVVSTDVAVFRDTVAAADREQEDRIKSELYVGALRVFKGNLLPGHDASWILPQQLSLEEEYAQAAVKASDSLCRLGDPDQAVRVAKSALTLFPLREDIHIAAMKSQAMAGRPTEAIRQFEELERMLDDQWGEQPSAEAVRALENLPDAIERLETQRSTAEQRPGHPQSARAVVTPTQGNRLPSRMTVFIGRAHEIEQIVESLDPLAVPLTRLMTITGPGGCGKTRLSTEVARSLIDPFGRRVWHVSLAETVDPALIVNEIRSALGIVPSPRSDPFAQVTGYLGAQPSFLVLDNFEQLVDEGTAAVGDLLAQCPRLTCLVTSRRPLHLEGEHVFPISPLPVPGADRSVTGLQTCESVLLFLDRARAVRPDFRLSRNNADAVAELCRRLDGLPLALELAASKASVASPAQILARLGERSDFLSSRIRNTPERHRSLKATIDWSVKLLRPEEVDVFRHCGVFRGGWTLEAATSLCPGCPVEQVLDTLVENSLIQAMPCDDGTRFSMLEPIRESAQSLLAESGAEAVARRRHLVHFAQFAEDQGRLLNGPSQAGAANLIQEEMDNLREAVEWSTKQPECPEEALRLVGGIRAFFGYRGHSELWYRSVATLLDLPYSGTAEPRVQALLCSGALGYYRSEFDSARSAYDDARTLSEKHELNLALGDAISGQGICCRAKGEFENAFAFYDEALAIGLKSGALGTAARVLYNLGSLTEFLDKLEEAQDHYTASLEFAEKAEDVRMIARNRDGLGRLALQAGDPEAAILQHQAAGKLLADVGDRIGEIHVLGNIAVLELTLNRPEAAVAMFRETLAPSWELQNYWELRSNLVYMAKGLIRLAKFEDAARALAAVAAIEVRYPIEMRKADLEAYDEAQKAVEDKLGQDRFHKISTEVGTLPLGEVVHTLSL